MTHAPTSATDPARTAGALIRAKAGAHPDRVLCARGSERLTYGEADAASARMARGLLASGVAKGTRVGLLLPNSPDWIVAWLAATRIGALLVPLNTFYQARELGWALRHADVSLLLTAGTFLRNDYLERLERFAPELASADGPPLHVASLPFLREVRVFAGHGDADGRRWTSGSTADLGELADRTASIDEAFLREVESEVTPADPMVVVYSSGSTAEPKGAIHTHGTVLGHAANLNAMRDLVPEDRIYSPMPYFWVGGLVFTLVSAIHVGCTLHVQDVFDAGRTLDLVERERITIVAGWPHYGKAMADHPTFRDRDLSSIRAGLLQDLLPEGRGPVDPELRHGSLGMTETCGPHTFGRAEVELPETLRGSFGQAVPGVTHKIVSPETGERLPAGEAGEIAVRGASVMQGLYKREREEVFDEEGFYHTGDGGRFDDEGHLFFHGRLGELIKTAGANVTPREVELVMETLPGVLGAHVVGVPHPDRGENVAAAVLPKDGADLDPETLRASLRKELSAYKVPRHLVFLAPEELPMTDTGKLDRRGLKALLIERIETGTDC